MAVAESEVTITLPFKTLTAGTHTFKVTNKGKFAHDLTVDGAGVQDEATPTLAPGSTGDFTVSFRKAPMSSIAPSTVIKRWEWTSPFR